MLALKDGITNTLGMKFVIVKGVNAMFCIHEVRRQDYAPYATEVPGVDAAWKKMSEGGTPAGAEDNHPVVGVSWEDAQAFSAWLSKKEGRKYRLPTDKEWSYAVGIGRDEKWAKDTTPEMLSGKAANEFPWGGTFPPQTKDQAGNYADTVWKDKFPARTFIEGYTDGFATTAPVMSFKPNKLGIYDLGGNVGEWVEDWFNAAQKDRVLRGGSLRDSNAGGLNSSYRYPQPATALDISFGFRIVLVQP